MSPFDKNQPATIRADYIIDNVRLDWGWAEHGIRHATYGDHQFGIIRSEAKPGRFILHVSIDGVTSTTDGYQKHWRAKRAALRMLHQRLYDNPSEVNYEEND
jgi:hypothetical protein